MEKIKPTPEALKAAKLLIKTARSASDLQEIEEAMKSFFAVVYKQGYSDCINRMKGSVANDRNTE